MKKRTLCLLLAGVMALSVLSGCGGKTADDQPNTPDTSNTESGGDTPINIPNDSGDTPINMPDDWEDPAQPEDDLPFPRDPRWDELKPGETAVQYYDIFIKSGMTVDEVVEAVESSDVYQDQFITWEIDKGNRFAFDDYSSPDSVIKIASTYAATRNVLITTSNGQETVSEKGTREIPKCSVTIKCDGRTVISANFFGVLPGAKDETYRVGDLLVFLVRPGSRNDSILSFVGWVGDLEAVDKDSVEGLLDVFKAWNPDTEMTSERKSYNSNTNVTQYNFYSHIPFSASWNGYSLWYCPEGGEPIKGVIPVYSWFSIDAATGKLADLNPSYNINAVGDTDSYYLYWAADDAG